jgi:hypothetical protein
MPRAKVGNQDGESSTGLPSPLRRNSSHSSTDIMNIETPVSTVPSLPHLPHSDTNNSDDDVDVVQPPITHSAAHPLPFISGSHRPFTIQSMLNPLTPLIDANDSAASSNFDPSDVVGSAQRSGGGLSSLVDPVLRGLISIEMAEHLYTLYVFVTLVCSDFGYTFTKMQLFRQTQPNHYALRPCTTHIRIRST